MFKKPTDKEEIANIISSLLKNEISKQLADIFTLPFMNGVFPLVLKIAKVVPVFKKDSKLDYINSHPISLLSNIEKITERYKCKRLHSFLSNNNNSNNNNIIYNLQFGFRQIYSTSDALINITENIGKAFDDGNVGRLWTFCKLAKSF